MSKIRFSILPHGHIENDLAWNIAVPNPASKSNKNSSAQWISVPSFSVLIEHSELGYLLYDTGSCPGDERERLPPYTREFFPLFADRKDFLDKKLEELHLKPSSLSAVIVSHMHWDHSGGLKFFEGTKAGENVYVHKKDFMYGLCVTHQSPEVFAGGGYFKDNFEFNSLSFRFVEEDENFADGIDIVTLEGHSPGLLGLVVETLSGVYIFPSDSVYTSRNYGPPECFPGIIYDTLGFTRSIAKLRRLEKKYNAQIIFPHDPEQFSTLKKSPYFYE
ncbi:MAG: N-acyl homoserine lactonase family protein [Oscillospiraceae bacterium]|nr:N-acyl homoserine lactonase family protein [Oscillospiraceae bacterium]